MSDTKVVREMCKHKRYDRHVWGFGPDDWCDGGGEIELRVDVEGCVTYYEGEVFTPLEVGPTLAEVEDHA